MTAAHSITCPSCGGTIAIKAAGYSVTVACQYCGSVLDVANPDVKVIEEYHQAALTLPLPLGSRGTLFDVEWEVVGYLERGDGEASWSEYLLFNPYAGYRWIVHAEGDWQFGTMIFDQPDGDDSSVTWRGRRFTRDYPPAATTTSRVVGEFYWRVRAGDSVQAMTYSRGDETLSVEWGADEANWTQLVALRENELLSAFGMASPQMTATVGQPDGLMSRVAANYRSAEGMQQSDLLQMFLLAAGTSLLILLVMAAFGFSTTSIHDSLQIVVDGPEKNATVGSLTISRPYQFVTVTARTSDFVNRWVDLDYSLVDRQTQQSIEASGTVEYYSGRDSDGDWTEGSHQTVTKFAAVPRGTYDVVVDASAHAWSDGTSYQGASGAWAAPEAITVYVQADAGGLIWSNYFAVLFALFGLPALVAWYRNRE